EQRAQAMRRAPGRAVAGLFAVERHPPAIVAREVRLDDAALNLLPGLPHCLRFTNGRYVSEQIISPRDQVGRLGREHVDGMLRMSRQDPGWLLADAGDGINERLNEASLVLESLGQNERRHDLPPAVVHTFARTAVA